MSLFLDFLVIAVFALCVYTGVRYGFIRSVMSIVVLVLSLLGSIHFSPALSDYLQVNHIEPAVTKQAEKSVEALISGVDSMDLDRLFSESPEAFVNVIEKFGVDYEEVKEHFENRLSGAADSARELAHYIAEPLAEKISDAAAFVKVSTSRRSISPGCSSSHSQLRIRSTSVAVLPEPAAADTRIFR